MNFTMMVVIITGTLITLNWNNIVTLANGYSKNIRTSNYTLTLN